MKGYYRNLILCDNAYPGDNQHTQLGQDSWDYATQENSAVFPQATLQNFNPHILRLIADTSWAVRGAVKSEAKRLVPTHFRLHPPETLEIANTQRTHEYTHERVKYLLYKHHFLKGELQGVSIYIYPYYLPLSS